MQRSFLIISLSAIFLASCATVQDTKRPPVSESLASPHRERAKQLTVKGRLRDALRSWEIALTIDPGDAVALKERDDLNERIHGMTTERLDRGQQALKRKAYLEARGHFLAVLALDPSNADAFSALQDQVHEVRQVSHIVRAGESLAAIAQQYYGDRTRAEVIWEINQLPPNPKLNPGMVLRIPEIPGLPFARPESPAGRPRPDTPVPPGKAEPSEDPAYENPALIEAKEALENREYVLALSTLDQFLSQNPRNSEAMDLKRGALLEHGKALMGEDRLADSLAAFTQLSKLNPRDANVTSLMQDVRGRLVRQHYNQGIRLYREEQLTAAIDEWRTVLKYDPNHAGAKKNIQAAEQLLKGLQERQQKRGG